MFGRTKWVKNPPYGVKLPGTYSVHAGTPAAFYEIAAGQGPSYRVLAKLVASDIGAYTFSSIAGITVGFNRFMGWPGDAFRRIVVS